MSKATIVRLWAAGDAEALQAEAEAHPSRVLRFLVGRLCSADAAEKLRALETLGWIVADPERVPEKQVLELMRRFLWALNDESGAVPFGIPEGIGEVLFRRPELRETYVPILASFLTDAEMVQTGPIERGVMWGLGRVGPPTLELAPHGVEALERLAASHAEGETRAEAGRALEQIRG